jgi:hypothetical protein
MKIVEALEVVNLTNVIDEPLQDIMWPICGSIELAYESSNLAILPEKAVFPVSGSISEGHPVSFGDFVALHKALPNTPGHSVDDGLQLSATYSVPEHAMVLVLPRAKLTSILAKHPVGCICML